MCVQGFMQLHTSALLLQQGPLGRSRLTSTRRSVTPLSPCIRPGQLRCYSSGRREQNSFNLLSWGANLIKKLGGPSPTSPAPVNEQRPAIPQTPERKNQADSGQSQAESRSAEEAYLVSEAPSTSGRLLKDGVELESWEGSLPLDLKKKVYWHLSRGREVTEDWPEVGTPTWDDWQLVCMETSEREEEVGRLHQRMIEATEEEDYSTAAKVKAEIQSAAEEDEVLELVQSYAEALETEDFMEAAHLRDFGGVGLMGWWWPQSSNAENPNHVLRVVPSYNRYVFLAYDPVDLAKLHGVSANDEPMLVSSEALQYNPNPSRRDFDQVGMPIMELLFHRFGSEEGYSTDPDLRAQAVALRCASDSAHAESNSSDKPQAAGPGSEEGQSDPSKSEEEEEEDEEVIKMEGIAVANPTGGESSIPIIHVSVNEPDDEGDSSSFLQQIAAASSDGLDDLQVPDFAPHIEEAVIERTPAVLQKFENDRDRFLVHILQSKEEEAAAKAAAEEQASFLARADADDSSPQVKVVHRHQEPGKQEVLNKLVDMAKDKGLDMKQGVSVEVRFKGNIDKKKMDFKSLAEEIVKGSNSSSLESGTVAEILKNVFDKISKGGRGSRDLEAGLKGSISYKRIPLSPQRTDPFTGIYVGNFGGHGPEILQLQRCCGEDGKEYCEGTKLTGDENVPAGNVSFRAAIGVSQRLSASRFFPPELGVTARYKGYGRIAEVGYKNASWIDGELLEFGSGPREVSKGAQLAFLWNISDEMKHLSLLHRLSLDDPLEESLASFAAVEE